MQNKPQARSRSLWKRALILLALTLIAELALSNLYSLYHLLFHADHQSSHVDMTSSPDQENVWEDGTFLVDGDHLLLYFSSFTSPVHSLSLTVQYADGADKNRPVYAELYGKDENRSEETVLYAQQALVPGVREPVCNRIRLSTHGTPSVLELYFDSEAELLIRDVRFNEPEGFSFSFLRWGVLVVLAALLWLGKAFDLSRRRLNPFSRGGKTALVVLLLVSLGICLCVSVFFMGDHSFSLIRYPLLAPEEHYSPYVQQFDAFQKGQLALDVSVSQELAALENPYDISQREGVEYLWDRAYYQGSYYSYFGLAPILCLYYPFYWLCGSLPGDGLVLSIFSAMAGIFTILCLWELCKLTKKKLSILQFSLGASACLFASMIWLMQRGVDRFYYVASLSATAFGLLTLYCLLKGLFRPKALSRRLWLAGAGVAFSLLLASRITSALLMGVAVACCVVIHLSRNRRRISTALADLVCPAVTVTAALAALLAFNAARFGNPLEFGTAYQLTVSNTAYNALSLENLLPSLYHYFFEPLVWSTQFPFVQISSRLLPNYGHYAYVAETNAGLLIFPLLWALFAFGALWKKQSLPKAYRRSCLVVLVALPAMAFLTFSLGGSILRYVGDLAPLAAILSTMILWEICDGASQEAPCHGERSVLAASKWLWIATVAVGCFLLFIHDCPDLAPYSTQIYGALQGIFTL